MTGHEIHIARLVYIQILKLHVIILIRVIFQRILSRAGILLKNIKGHGKGYKGLGK